MTATGHQRPARHKLVTLGDSLTQGFQSFAIYNTDISYPAMIAEKLGLSGAAFRYPSYRPVQGEDFMGPPMNLEYLARKSGEPDCVDKSPVELMELAVKAFRYTLESHRHWGSEDRIKELQLDDPPDDPPIMHNLAVAGFDVRDLFTRTADTDQALLHGQAESTDLGSIAIAPNTRALISLPVLLTARRRGRYLTPVAAAEALGEDGRIETLVVFIGANNALGTVISLDIRETGKGYDSLEQKGKYNLWRPEHFNAEFHRLVDAVKKIKTDRALWGTVPHVTTAPLAHGVKGRMASNPQFFNYYTYPWIPEDRFRPSLDPRLTGRQVIQIDSYIDSYNATIASTVRQAQQEGRSWHVVDICARMDSVAYERYWDPNESRLTEVRRQRMLPEGDDYVAALPEGLRDITARGRIGASPGDRVVPPDSRFFRSDASGRREGGLVALDGTHPTTIGYGILAEAFLKVMGEAGVDVGDGKIDFIEALGRDSLVSNPPNCVNPDMKGLGWGQLGWDWVSGFAKTMDRPKPRHWRFVTAR